MAVFFQTISLSLICSSSSYLYRTQQGLNYSHFSLPRHSSHSPRASHSSFQFVPQSINMHFSSTSSLANPHSLLRSPVMSVVVWSILVVSFSTMISFFIFLLLIGCSGLTLNFSSRFLLRWSFHIQLILYSSFLRLVTDFILFFVFFHLSSFSAPLLYFLKVH